MSPRMAIYLSVLIDACQVDICIYTCRPCDGETSEQVCIVSNTLSSVEQFLLRLSASALPVFLFRVFLSSYVSVKND